MSPNFTRRLNRLTNSSCLNLWIKVALGATETPLHSFSRTKQRTKLSTMPHTSLNASVKLNCLQDFLKLQGSFQQNRTQQERQDSSYFLYRNRRLADEDFPSSGLFLCQVLDIGMNGFLIPPDGKLDLLHTNMCS